MTSRAILDIIVTPKSSRRLITIGADCKIRVYLNAPPADNRANEECVRLFSDVLKTAKSNISIKSGQKGRKKRIIISGMTPEEVMIILKK